MRHAYHLEEGAHFVQFASHLGAMGWRRTDDRRMARVAFVKESTATRLMRTSGWSRSFGERAHVTFLPGILNAEDKCELASLLHTTTYHPKTYIGEVPPSELPLTGRWVEKMGLGGNGDDVHLLTRPPTHHRPWRRPGWVLQRYEPDVFLFGGCKFDMRYHIIIFGDGRVFLHDDALMRCCTVPYTHSATSRLATLTNVAIQKTNDPSLDRAVQFLRDHSDIRQAFLPSMKTIAVDVAARLLHAAMEDDGAVGKDFVKSGHVPFRMVGLDILPMHDGSVRLLEFNFRPGVVTDGKIGSFFNRLLSWAEEILGSEHASHARAFHVGGSLPSRTIAFEESLVSPPSIALWLPPQTMICTNTQFSVLCDIAAYHTPSDLSASLRLPWMEHKHVVLTTLSPIVLTPPSSPRFLRKMTSPPHATYHAIRRPKGKELWVAPAVLEWGGPLGISLRVHGEDDTREVGGDLMFMAGRAPSPWVFVLGAVVMETRRRGRRRVVGFLSGVNFEAMAHLKVHYHSVTHHVVRDLIKPSPPPVSS